MWGKNCTFKHYTTLSLYRVIMCLRLANTWLTALRHRQSRFLVSETVLLPSSGAWLYKWRQTVPETSVLCSVSTGIIVPEDIISSIHYCITTVHNVYCHCLMTGMIKPSTMTGAGNAKGTKKWIMQSSGREIQPARRTLIWKDSGISQSFLKETHF